MYIFLATLLATLVGAVSGAYATHRVSEKASAKKNLLRQLNITDSLISYVFAEINSNLSLKGQYILPTYNQYKIDQAKYAIYKNQIPNGKKPDIRLNFGQFEFGGSNVSTIASLSKEIHRLSPRCIVAIISLSKSDNSIEEILRQRKKFIEDNFRDKEHKTKIAKLELYLGCYRDEQSMSTEFANLTEALYQSVNDSLYFSAALSEELFNHRKYISRILLENFSYINNNDFKISFDAVKELFPDDKNYTSWEKGFQYAESNNSANHDSWWMKSSQRNRR